MFHEFHKFHELHRLQKELELLAQTSRKRNSQTTLKQRWFPTRSIKQRCTQVVSSKSLLHSKRTTVLIMDRPSREHTELEEELHETAHIDYDRVAIV